MPTSILLWLKKYVMLQTKSSCLFCLCYIRGCHVREMFVNFVEVVRITGRELASTILHRLTDCGLPLSKLTRGVLQWHFQHGRV